MQTATKVLVTGATGFVGQEILRALQKAGHSIRILARRPDSETVRVIGSRYGAEVCAGDVTDSRGLEEAVAGAEAVIHLVGIISEVGEVTFENVHVRGTGNLVTAARASGIRRFIHMSALGTRPNAVSRYHQTKWAAEELVRQSGLDYTIFRPSLIFGPHDHFVNMFAEMARFSPVLPVIGQGRARFQPVAVEVVAQAFVEALRKPESIGQTYDLGGPETLTFPEMLDQIVAAMGKRRLKVRIPLGIARCQAAFLEAVYPRLLRKAPPLNRDQLIMLQEGNTGQAEKANEVFDLPRVRFEDGIREHLGRDARRGHG